MNERSSIRLAARPVAEKLRANVKERAEAFQRKAGRKAKLAVVLVGDDPASVIYTSKKGDAALGVSMDHETVRFPASANPSEVHRRVQALNGDPNIDGILIQRPLPSSFNEDEVMYWVAPEKDVDAFHPENVGKLVLGLPAFVSCTPAGVMEILRHYGIEPSGKTAVVIGRSAIVGKPMSALLLNAGATVIQCHRLTPDLKAMTQQADILVVAAGRKHLIRADHVKPGAVVVDVGIHRLPDGKVTGDVDYDAVAPIASAITPVPGGVGPMTITMLLMNTIWSAERCNR